MFRFLRQNTENTKHKNLMNWTSPNLKNVCLLKEMSYLVKIGKTEITYFQNILGKKLTSKI